MSREVRRTDEYILYHINLDCPHCQPGEVVCAVKVWPSIVGDAVECVGLTYALTCSLTPLMSRWLHHDACAEALQEYRDSIQRVSREMLAGRQARCPCGKTALSEDVRGGFYEFRGEGSYEATKVCGTCKYHESVHGKLLRHVCLSFRPRGAMEYDAYYCGHTGGSEAPER